MDFQYSAVSNNGTTENNTKTTCDLCFEKDVVLSDHYILKHNYPHCGQCRDVTLLNYDLWKQHITMNHDMREKHCPYTSRNMCNYKNIEISAIETHINDSHPSCPNCGRTELHYRELDNHIKLCFNNNHNRKCPYNSVHVCNFECITAADMTSHIKMHHPNCPKCYKAFNDRSNHADLRRHLVKCYELNRRACPYAAVGVCQFECFDTKDMTKHVKKDHPRCRMCNYEYACTNHHNIKEHIVVCYKSIKRICPYSPVNGCEFSCIAKQNMTDHLLNVHPRCPKCGIEYNIKFTHTDVGNHLALCYNGEGRHVCDKCGKGESNFQNLRHKHFCGETVNVNEFFSQPSLTTGFIAIPDSETCYVPTISVGEQDLNRGLITSPSEKNLKELPLSFRWLRHDRFCDGELLLLFALAEHVLRNPTSLWLLLVDTLLDLCVKHHHGHEFEFIKYNTPEYIDRKYEDPTVVRNEVARIRSDLGKRIYKLFGFRSGRPAPFERQQLGVLHRMINKHTRCDDRTNTSSQISLQKLPMAQDVDTQGQSMKQNCVERRQTEPVVDMEKNQLKIVADFILTFYPVYARFYGENVYLLPLPPSEMHDVAQVLVDHMDDHEHLPLVLAAFNNQLQDVQHGISKRNTALNMLSDKKRDDSWHTINLLKRKAVEDEEEKPAPLKR